LAFLDFRGSSPWEGDATMHRKYRALEHACQVQAALTCHEQTRQELNKMAQEYRRLAEWLERRLQSPADEARPADAASEI
jgi:hypothetical protein